MISFPRKIDVSENEESVLELLKVEFLHSNSFENNNNNNNIFLMNKKFVWKLFLEGIKFLDKSHEIDSKKFRCTLYRIGNLSMVQNELLRDFFGG